MIATEAAAALAGSVAMHVAWNLQTQQARTDVRFLWWAIAGFLVLVGPWSLWYFVREADWSGALGWYLLVTCVAEALYFMALGIAYRHAPVPLVYPIARSSPLWIAIWTTLFFGVTLTARGWLGILVVVTGVLWLAWTARGGELKRALPWAVSAAFATSVYSTSNQFAIASMPNYAVVLGYVSVTLVAAWLVLTLENRYTTGKFVPRRKPNLVSAALGGIFIGNAYALVIFAMHYIPAAYAVAFTNAGIVSAGLIAMIAFRERHRWRTRLAAMLVVLAGLALLAAE